MFDIGFDEVEHSDSDGIATPRDIADYFQVILEKHPDPARHSFHIHDIRGMGIAGYYAAMLAGIRTFDCTVGGIGGQVANFLDGVPVKGAGDYYFDTCRTGLVSTEDFITMVNGMGEALRSRPQSGKDAGPSALLLYQHGAFRFGSITEATGGGLSVCMGLGWRLKF